ncbi:MAG: hypothetical protein GEU79_15165 [Acidimicrobiia bacterium]|nr:hypothetical protein [Acidimicrobiia bacterium]
MSQSTVHYRAAAPEQPTGPPVVYATASCQWRGCRHDCFGYWHRDDRRFPDQFRLLLGHARPASDRGRRRRSGSSFTTRDFPDPDRDVRAAVTACLVAGLLVAGDWSGPTSGALLGLALTVLPLVLLTGSVVHEGIPIRTAAAHAGDWVIKLTVIGAVTGMFI